MEEEQVQGKIPATDLHGILRSNEAEIASQLDQKVLQLVQQTTMQVCFRMGRRQTEKLHGIGIPEDAEGFRVHLSHRWRDFWRIEHNTLEQSGIELALQFALAIALPDSKPQVELAFFRAFTLPENDEMMRPRQLSHQW